MDVNEGSIRLISRELTQHPTGFSPLFTRSLCATCETHIRFFYPDGVPSSASLSEAKSAYDVDPFQGGSLSNSAAWNRAW